MLRQEKLWDHQNDYSSSWGKHECLYKIARQSLKWLLRYFSLDQSGGPKVWLMANEQVVQVVQVDIIYQNTRLSIPSKLTDWTGAINCLITYTRALTCDWFIIYARVHYFLNYSFKGIKAPSLCFRPVSLGKRLKKSCFVINVNHCMSLSCTEMKTAH